MTSLKQLEANRRNAKHSSGPKSTEGKARSSRNALKHGLVSSEIVIWDEDPDQFELLRAGFEADFQPNSTVVRELVDHLAGLFWRLRRLPALEAALIEPDPELVESQRRMLESQRLMLFQFTVPTEQRELIVEILKHKDPHLDISGEPSDSPEDSEALRLLPEEDRRYIRAHLRRWKEERMLLASEEEDDSGTKVHDSNNPPGGDNQTTSRPHGATTDAAINSMHTPTARETAGRKRIRKSLKFITTHGEGGMARLSRHQSSLMNDVNRTWRLIHSLQASGLVARDSERRRQ
jgi:hypothetical protein